MASRDFVTGTEAQIDEIRAADDLAEGLPMRGTPVGAGPHRAQTDDPASPGWTRHAQRKLQHPTTPGLWAYPAEGLALKLFGRLPPQALARIAAAGPLTPDWGPPGLETKVAP